MSPMCSRLVMKARVRFKGYAKADHSGVDRRNRLPPLWQAPKVFHLPVNRIYRPGQGIRASMFGVDSIF